MRRTGSLAIIYLLLLLSAVFSGDRRYHPESRLYEQDKLYRILDELYVSSGELMPGQDFLLTWGDARECFESWQDRHATPSDVQRVLIDRVSNMLSGLGEKGQVKISLGIDVLRHTVPDCTVTDQFYRVFRDKDFNVKYADRERFADAELQLPLHRTLFIATRTTLRNDWKYFNSRSTDIPRNLKEFNIDLNERSLLQFHLGRFRIIFGRDRLSLGLGKFGKLLIGNQIPETTHLHLQYRYRDIISYNQFVATMKNAVLPEDRPKILYAHRLTYRFLKRYSIALTEQLMTNQSLNAAYLVPFMVYHNLYDYPEQRNVMTALDVEAVPISGLMMYGSWVVDEIDSKALEENGDRGREAWGLLMGMEWSQPFALPMLTVNAEYVKLTDWLYNHAFPWFDFYTMNFVFEERRGLTDPDEFHRFIGHPLGSNAEALLSRIHWQDLELRCNYIRQGEIPIFSRAFSRPVSQIKERRLIMGLNYQRWLWNDQVNLNTSFFYTSSNNFHQIENLNVDYWEFWFSLKIKLLDLRWDMRGIL